MSEAASGVVIVEELAKDFHVGLGLRTRRVLHEVSFAVSPGEIFGFVGPNGAGKTTTLKILMGLIRPTSGRASILGHDVRETEFRRQVGFLPESPYFYEYLTGREFLRFYARVCGVPKAERERRLEALLDLVGLAAAGGVRLRAYSKGMLQRIGIAQALVHDPKVVFLDEPMSGLDPIGRKEIRDLILRLRSEGKTVFMNTHILSDVEMLCDRVAVIVEGRIRYAGRPVDFQAGESREVDVVVARVDPALIERLEAEAPALLVRTEGERLELRVEEKRVREVLSTVLQQGGEVLSVAPRRASLETIFLSAVKGEIR